MWVQLHLQPLKCGLRQMLLQLCRAQFPLPVLPVIIKGVAHRNDDPINKQIEMPGLHQQWLEHLVESGLTLPLSYPRADQHVSERKENAGDRVRSEAVRPVAAFKSKPPRQ